MKHCTFPLRTSSTIERIEHEPCYERTIEDRLIGRGARAFRRYPECSRERGRLEFIIDSSSFPSKVESFRAISKIFENDAREARRNKLSIEKYYEYSRKWIAETWKGTKFAPIYLFERWKLLSSEISAISYRRKIEKRSWKKKSKKDIRWIIIERLLPRGR